MLLTLSLTNKVLLHELHFCAVALLQREVETVRLEEGMVLSCLCPWKGNLSMVSWTKTFENNPVAVFHPEFGKSFSHRYRDRVEFLRTSPLDGSISIKNVTHQDIGNYQCSVQTFPQGPWTTDIQVEDLGNEMKSSDHSLTQLMFGLKLILLPPIQMNLQASTSQILLSQRRPWQSHNW